MKKSYTGESLGIETERGAAIRVILLRDALLKHHGSNTFRIIAQHSKPGTKAEMTELLDWELLERLDAMEEPNIARFAAMLAEENKRLPKEERRGARGESPVALDKYIRRLLKHRQVAMKSDQWFGPVPLK